MQILFINNDGGGFADRLVIRNGMTVREFFNDRLPDRSSSDYMIRVNRQPTDPEYVLNDGDRISFTPVKIQGARAA